jgi:predicted transcriptional regulator
MPEDTEFVILTKNNYDRQQKDLALENIKLKETNEEHRKINGQLQEENQKLVKVFDELLNYLIKKLEEKKFDNDFERYTAYEDILNKLTELKGGNK